MGRQRNDDSLGPCGCVDYHMADCPLRTSSADLEFEEIYFETQFMDNPPWPEYDPKYDDPMD